MGEVVYGRSHISSTLGILKILEIIACVLAAILVAVGGTWTNSHVSAYYAGIIIGITISLIIIVLSSTEAGHSLNGVLKFQYIIHLLLFIYILIVSSIMVSRRYTNYHRVGGIFGLFGAIFYLGDAGISYKAYGNHF